MRLLVTALLLSLISLTSAQEKDKMITDISPDGKLTNTYKASEASELGTVIKSALTIPYGTAPDWTSSLERQIGGMAFADYDGDGDLDLATGCYFSNSYPPIPNYEVLIYRNDNGVLTTSPVWISSDMRSTTDIKFADINRDGRIDLLACNGDNSFAPSVIYMNSETGLPTTPTWIASPFAWSVGAAFGDVDGDGDLDLAFGNQGNSVIPTKPINIFFNNNGVFTTSPNWASADEMITNTVAFGDVNNSRLVSATQTFTGDGNKKAFQLSMLPLYSIDTVMVNNIIVNAWCYDKIGAWISFANAPEAGAEIKVKHRYFSKGDLAASKWVNYSSAVYFNNNGTMNTSPGWITGITTGQKGIVWEDFDRDGYSDLAISGSSLPIYIYKNDNGNILTTPIWASASVSPSAQELISGDIDNDGYPELACVHFGSKRIEVYKNRNGVLDTAPTWLYIAGTSATSIAFGDVDGDGRLDLAVGTARSPVVVFLNQLPPVPVELLSFNAITSNGKIILEWTTATETNNQGFYIERSADKINWEELGFIQGAGTSTSKNNYRYEDPASGNYYYRLRQIDFDGSITYSKIIYADVNSISPEFNCELFPNPSPGKTKISVNLPAKLDIEIKVVDILGNTVRAFSFNQVAAGQSELNPEIGGLSSGVYILKVSFANKTINKKLIINR